MLHLKYDLAFADLHSRTGLLRLDAAFVGFVAEIDAPLAARLQAGRAAPDSLAAKDESQLLIDLAPHLDDFIGGLFGIEAEVKALQARHAELAPLYTVKRNFVQRRSLKGAKPDALAALDGAALAARLEALFGEPLTELAFARHVSVWEQDEAANADKLAVAQNYAAWAALSDAGIARHGAGVLFKQPRKLDPTALVRHLHSETVDGHICHTLEPEHYRRREGFALTDQGTDLVGALDQANYCIWCHHQGKDSCSKGLREKPAKDQVGQPPFRKSAFGVALAGCPLEEKISEFHSAKVAGWSLGALGIIIVDNPMLAATGHRLRHLPFTPERMLDALEGTA